MRHRRVFFSGGSHGGAHGRYQSQSTVLRRIFGEGGGKKTTGVADDEVDKSLSFSQDLPPPPSPYTHRRPTLAAQSPFPEQQTSRLVRHMHPERRKGSMRSIREGGGQKGGSCTIRSTSRPRRAAATPARVRGGGRRKYPSDQAVGPSRGQPLGGAATFDRVSGTSLCLFVGRLPLAFACANGAAHRCANYICS